MTISARTQAIIESVRDGNREADTARSFGVTRQWVEFACRRSGVESPHERGKKCRLCGGRFTTGEPQHNSAPMHCAFLAHRAEERFWAKVQKTATCWLWRGSLYPTGYGAAHRFGEGYAHRVAYRLINGLIPKGLTLDHLCRNRACVNPAHLEPVTSRENILRGVGAGALNARKTQCSLGHPFEGNNLIVTKTGRSCRVCRNARALRYYHTRKPAAA